MDEKKTKGIILEVVKDLEERNVRNSKDRKVNISDIRKPLSEKGIEIPSDIKFAHFFKCYLDILKITEINTSPTCKAYYVTTKDDVGTSDDETAVALKISAPIPKTTADDSDLCIGMGKEILDITDYVFVDFGKHIDAIKPYAGYDENDRDPRVKDSVLDFVTFCFNIAVKSDKVIYHKDKVFFPVYKEGKQTSNEYGQLQYFQSSKSTKPELDNKDNKGRKNRKLQGLWIVSSSYIDTLFETRNSNGASAVLEKGTIDKQSQAYDLKDCLKQDAAFIAKIKEYAMPEYWGKNDTVLLNYLEHTYYRLNEENKIVKGKNSNHLIYNTGLLDSNLNELSLLVVQNKEGGFESPDIIYEDDIRIPHGVTLKLAKYFEELQDVVFNAFKAITPVYTHILENAARIEKYKEDVEKSKDNDIELGKLEAKIKKNVREALKKSLSLAKRNFKYAIPQYYRDDKEYQFMLPLFLNDNSNKPDCVLVVRNARDGGDYYEGITILTLEMAYNNARLLSRPDVSWLQQLQDKIAKP